MLGGVNKTMQSSKGEYNTIRPVELVIIIEGSIYENVISAYLECDNVPIIWKIVFLKIANDRDNVYNGPNTFNQHRCERHFHNLNSCKSIINGCF